ncbi:MAG: polysaccharide biosynthesis C-terminal domain-containing protein, partial [Saprospiraceae bacterium]
VARYIADDNVKELEDLYKRVSINLLVVGLLLFGALWVSIDSLYTVLPNGAKVAAGHDALFFLGLAKLADMCTGVNNYMIYYSRYYRYSLLSLIVLAVINISLCFWLIPLIGLTGAALATFFSVVCYNAVSVGMVWRMFRLQPFTAQTLWALGMALLAFGVAWWLPHTGNGWVDICLRSGLYILLFGSLVLWQRLSPDMNGMVEKLVKRVRD